jgi:hypothetical protein
MTDLIPFDDWQNELAKAIEAIQQPRTDYQIEKFVVGQHVSEARRWHQCVLELQIKFQNLRRGQIQQRQMARKLAKLEAKGTPEANDKAALLRLDMEDHALAMLGAMREAQCLWAIYQSFGRNFTRDELNAAEGEFWQKRLTMQAQYDLNATGRIGVGNQDALRMAGIDPSTVAGNLESVEQRFLSQGKIRILVVTPTLIPQETIERDGLACRQGWSLPGTVEFKPLVIIGKPVAVAYNEAAQMAIDDDADFLLCVEDDHLIPAGTFEKLWSVYQQHGPRAIVGAWYPQRKEPRTGTAIVLVGGRREFLLDRARPATLHVNGIGQSDILYGRDRGSDDGGPIEVFGIPQGFTLIPTQAFREIPQPWFVTTDNLTQDSYFSQQARDAGWGLFVDTSARIKHVDRETGIVYE